MKIRFQADADLNQLIVKATVRLEPGIDFQTGQTAGLAGLDDPDVLKLAADSVFAPLEMLLGAGSPFGGVNASLTHLPVPPPDDTSSRPGTSSLRLRR